MKHEWNVIITDDDGGESWHTVTLESINSWQAQAKQAIDEVTQDCLERGIRVAAGRIDWQEMAETALSTLEAAVAALDEISDARREANSCWEYYDADDVDYALSKFGKEVGTES